MALGDGPAEANALVQLDAAAAARAMLSSYCIYFRVSSGIAQKYPPGGGHHRLAISSHHPAFWTPPCMRVLGEQGGGSLMLCCLFVP